MRETSSTMTHRQPRRPAGPGRPETRATYYRRRAVALATAGTLAVGAIILGPPEYRAITGTTTADKLAKPFDQAQAEVRAGDFSPGSVREVRIPDGGGYAYDDALKLAGSNASENTLQEAYTDISAQRGNVPTAGEPVILPTDDLRPGLQK